MTVYPQVMFVTNKDDFAIDYIIYKFIDKKIPYLRLNSEDLTEFSATYNFNNDINIGYKDYEYNLSKLKSVYFRRSPTLFNEVKDVNDTVFINRERRDFLEGLYLTTEAKWINPIFSTYQAERKIYQLNAAKKIGFRVPNSIVTNNPLDILSFVNSNKECIIKPICHGLQITKEGAFSIYTSEINDINFLKSDLLFEAPVFVQNKIKNYKDIRATMIGSQIFAVEIDTNDVEKVDWRKPNLLKDYKVHNLPDEIRMQMYRLHKELNLVYSAFDFILTPEGEYYFLETNPAGEWVWLERELNIPISDAIINELIN